MTDPVLQPTLFVTVEGASYRVFGFETLEELQAVVAEALANATTLQLSIAGPPLGPPTHGTLFLSGSRVGVVVVSDADIFLGQHGTDVVPGQHGTD